MSEAATNGASQPGIDFPSAKAALFSSSTKTRIAQLRSIDEKLRDKSETSCSPMCLNVKYLALVLTFVFVYYSYRPILNTNPTKITL